MKRKQFYNFIILVAALFGIIDVLFEMGLIPKIPFAVHNETPQQPEKPIVVVVENKVEVPAQENLIAANNNVQANNSAENVSPKTESPAAFHNNDRAIAESFIIFKDSYHQQIAELAADVNEHLSRNVDFRNARYFLERSQQLVNDIRETENNLRKTKFENEILKNQILKVIEAEIIRADGIRDGVQSSYNGGNYQSEFERGHNGKIQFDRENATLIKMRAALSQSGDVN